MESLDFILSREWSLVLAGVCLANAAVILVRLQHDVIVRQFIREAFGIMALTLVFAALFLWSTTQPDNRTVRIVFRLGAWFAFTNILAANLLAIWKNGDIS